MITQAFSARSSNWMANARLAEGMRGLDDYGTSGRVQALADAKEAFREAVEIDPRFRNAHFHLAITRELAGEHEGAIAEFEGLLDETAAVPPSELLYNLGLAWFHLYHRGAYERALGYFDRAIAATQPRHADAIVERRTRLIRLLAKVGKAQVHAHQMLPETCLAAAQAAEAAESARSE
ncbi:MAG: hypothetical protein IMZ71_00580, partial [Chloroflexi bacterium]|nr:hypothetical protein [Chloroflexota bacterium]